MKRNTFAKVLRSACAYLIIFGLVAQMLPTTALASNSDLTASFIEKLEDLKVDYTDYLDNSVVLRLPEGVTNDDEISVIITVDTATIMEAYNGTDKSMSFKDFALRSEEAAAITAEIETKKTDILSLLPDELCETAYLRLENPELSIKDFGLMFEPPISKSGVNHRLKKIMDFAETNS